MLEDKPSPNSQAEAGNTIVLPNRGITTSDPEREAIRVAISQTHFTSDLRKEKEIPFRYPVHDKKGYRNETKISQSE